MFQENDSQLHVTAATRECARDHYQLGRYTWISHYASGVLDIGLQYWWRYRHHDFRQLLFPDFLTSYVPANTRGRNGTKERSDRPKRTSLEHPPDEY